VLLFFAILVQLGNDLLLGLQRADTLARILAFERQVRIGNAEALCVAGQTLRAIGTPASFGFLREDAEKIDVVGEDTMTWRCAASWPSRFATRSRRRWSREDTGSSNTMPPLPPLKTDFREEGTDRNGALLALAQNVAGTATLRQFQLQLVQGLALVRAALQAKHEACRRPAP
jgi:hypothetical protein